MLKYSLFIFSILVLFGSCKPTHSDNVIVFNQAMQTFSNYENVTCKHLDWKTKINFELKEIKGTATWTFENKTNEKFIHFDTYDMAILKTKVNGKETQYFVTDFNKEFGSGLSIPITEKDTIVSIEYTTGADATALQWLAPSQTAGGKLPYLFTQCESIHARSLLPCQDVPANRITYNAEVETPRGMMAVMSAKNPTEKNAQGKYAFEMEIPIPTYLIALAVGDIDYKAIDDRSGVYTEPSMLEKSANELSDIPSMMKVAEKLGGPYKWGKYDVLIAPPSFPIGGMENPRLTFATPTIIAGDKSLVSLIAHEMAHSWSGNLVTNATWNDLWLNEGYTTYFERRIMEEIAGKDYNEMMWELGYQDMQSDLNDMGLNGEDTKLKIDLKKRHPEDAFSNIAYEKGAIFLRMLEENIGRTAFDKYLNQYFQTNAFVPMTTEKALTFMRQHLFNGDSTIETKLLLQQWIYEPGLPGNCPKINPIRFIEVDKQRIAFEQSGKVENLKTSNWTTHEWLQFLRKLPHPFAISRMELLDTQFQLTNTSNSEIADEWFKLSISSNYEKAFAKMEVFLSKVGRKKFLQPLYSELMSQDKYKPLAKKLFEKYKNNYHPQTAEKISDIVNPQK
jgi:leukotriene A-4 hydrolase/aminopeptidase